MATLRPMGPWVLVEPIPFKRETAGGLILPQGSTEETLGYLHGIVKAVGPGKPKYPKGKGRVFEHSGLNEGDKVYFRSFIKDANKVNPQDIGDGTCLLHQDDILGVLDD